ncbi:MAG: radical SAM protein [Candidatus Aminicenantes bacterium]|nr:radical SAM protein [Candidatus Aminicenantes bacterium]
MHDLLESPRTNTVHIEFTSRCNLRCVFCFASQPGYKGSDLDAASIDNIIESLKSRNVKVVSVNGHGETTIYKNWHLYCNKMLDSGMPLHIISNFAREFSPEELHTLSRFKSIEISCDTSDPGLFKKLRRGADLGTLCINVLRLRGMALKENRQLPVISFSCVVSDKNVLNLSDYAAFGRALGVNHYNFCNLTKYPELEDTLNPNHITEMPDELLPEVEASLTETFDFLKRSNISYNFQRGLLDSLKQKIRGLNAAPVGKENSIPVEVETAPAVEAGTPSRTQPAPAAAAVPHRYSSSREGAQTRDCLDPWAFLLVQANKDVQPCCWHQPIHSLGKNQSLSEVFNNRQIKELRRRLLTGELSSYCMNCPSRGWTTIAELKRKVWNYLNPGINRLLSPRIPGIKPDVLNAFEVVYREGWYPLETNSDIEDPDWQSWRWTSKKAVCQLKNPGKNALLIIRGSVDKSVFRDQTIFFKINDTLLDEFIPGTAKFFKEYIIHPEMMGKAAEFSLILETDKVFSPSALNPGTGDNRELGAQIYHLFFGEKGRALSLA